jgi:hypothetical protein
MTIISEGEADSIVHEEGELGEVWFQESARGGARSV